MTNQDKLAIFILRNGGTVVTKVSDSHTIEQLGRSMAMGGFVAGRDSLWGRKRQLAINLSDVSIVELIDEDA